MKVKIIGSGFSGLSAAAFLAKEGHDVTVYEKHDKVGGRARSFQAEGFTFDMGPSWYWMPDVFERFFSAFGKRVADYYTLLRLDPGYKVLFSDATWDIPADMNALEALFEKEEKGSAKALREFLDEASYKYLIGIQKLVYKPGLELSELMDKELMSGVFKLDVFKSMTRHINEKFTSPKLRELLSFPVLFLGAKPENTPALYSLMNYADLSLGTWYPKGGMSQIASAMHSLCEELGVTFEFNSNVTNIAVKNGKATHIMVNGTAHEADIVVGSADYHHIESKLLEPKYRQYSESYWNNRTMAPSSLIFYLGVNKKVPNLEHHNLFFDTDFSVHAKEIYDTKKWPTAPLFYTCVTSKTDDSAPEGCENLFILIPVATDLESDEMLRDYYFNMVMDRLEERTKTNIRSHIVYKKSYAHSEFISDYNAFKGNAYGLANTLKQTAHLKPKIRSKKVKNLFYCGQLTVPGPGVPPALISGEVTSKLIKKEYHESSI